MCSLEVKDSSSLISPLFFFKLGQLEEQCKWVIWLVLSTLCFHFSRLPSLCYPKINKNGRKFLIK